MPLAWVHENHRVIARIRYITREIASIFEDGSALPGMPRLPLRCRQPPAPTAFSRFVIAYTAQKVRFWS
jgi:hypothetical protein